MTAYELLNDRGWCQGAEALDANDKSVKACSPDAVCYCAAGALRAVYGDYEPKFRGSLIRVLNALGIRCGEDGGEYDRLTTWNDRLHRSKEEVLSAFKTADV
jgi:hypothetical protein